MSSAGVRLVPTPLDAVPWDDLDSRTGRSVFRTRPWLEFLRRTQGAQPVVAQVLVDDDPSGWFTAAVVRRAGLRILGSPLRGWTTSSMGFDLDRPIPSGALLAAVRRHAFSDLRCVHLELMDRAIGADVAVPRDFRSDAFRGWELRIDRDDDELLAAMRPNGRRDVRRALRNGVTVEEVDPRVDPAFAAEYFGQVRTAFAKRGLAPTYPLERVTAMIEELHPAGLVVLLRARDGEGRSAATGLFPGVPGSAAVFWMGASPPEQQSLLPNEALMWHALRTWRERGAVSFDFGGGGEYKRKYGGDEIEVPWFRSSRVAALEQVRIMVKRRARTAQRRATPSEN